MLLHLVGIPYNCTNEQFEILENYYLLWAATIYRNFFRSKNKVVPTVMYIRMIYYVHSFGWTPIPTSLSLSLSLFSLSLSFTFMISFHNISIHLSQSYINQYSMSILFITKTSRKIKVWLQFTTRNTAVKFIVQVILIKKLQIKFVLIISSYFYKIMMIILVEVEWAWI